MMIAVMNAPKLTARDSFIFPSMFFIRSIAFLFISSHYMMAVAAPAVAFAVLAAPEMADSTVREAPPKKACPAPAVWMIQVDMTGVDITPAIATITPMMI
jgi:hypothetical protein